MLDFLKAILGENYTEEIDQKISEEVEKSFVSKTDFNNTSTELKNAKGQLVQRDRQLEELKKSSGDSEGLKQQIEQLQQQNAQQEQSFSEQVSKMKLDYAVEKTLTGAKAKNITAAKALLADFLKDAKLEEDGSVKGLDDAIKKLNEGQDTAFLFDNQKPGLKLSGAAPASGTTSTAGAEESAYQSRLSEARKTGNTLAAIQIKQEAAREGITLI